MAIVFRCGCGQRALNPRRTGGAVGAVPRMHEGLEGACARARSRFRQRPRVCTRRAALAVSQALDERGGRRVCGCERAGSAQPQPDSGAKQPAARAPAPAERRDGKSPREYLYLMLALALVPLVFSVLGPKSIKLEERLRAAIDGAGPETTAQEIEIVKQEIIEGSTFVVTVKATLPSGRADSTSRPSCWARRTGKIAPISS